MKAKRLLSILMMFLLLMSFVPAGLLDYEAEAVSAEMQEALNKKKELAEELARINKELAAIKDSIEKYEAVRNTHAARLENVKAQIAELEVIIEELGKNLALAQEQLDTKERELKESYRKFGQRLRVMYMNSNENSLSVLLGADSFADFLVSAEYMQRMNEHDATMIDEITALRNEVQSLRDDINKNLADQEDALAEQEVLFQEVAGLLQQANSNLSAAEAYQAATQEDYDRLYDEYIAQQETINNLTNVWSSEPYVGGDFRWPVPGYDWISSGYGWRTLYGRENFHTGIDIAGGGIYGAGVIASNQGTVKTVVYGSTGYGYYIIVDHGGSYMTLYAHLSAIYVSVGEPVFQGDVIGAVGSTGNSTGPHLHFEIRVGGSAVNPLEEPLFRRY